MITRTRLRTLTAGLALASALILSACGSTPAPQAVALPSSNGQPAADGAGGYMLPDCTGVAPENCIYDGFNPAVNGFSFANWAAVGSVDATSLVALFGEDAVCAQVTEAGCVLFPAADQWAAQVNEAMVGGHCEGMAVMAQRLFTNTATVQDLDPAAATTFALSKDDPDVTGAIDFWWATQMFVPVQEAYMAFHDYEPSEVAKELAQGIASKKNYTLALYSTKGSGHSITPFAVTFDGTTYAISVYDNNYPGTVQRVIVDPATERWSYAAGATSPGAPTDGWEGGKSTIDLTPMAARAVPTSAPFADSATKGTVTTARGLSNLLVTSADPDTRVGFTITVDGKTYDTTDPSAALPAGVYARPLLGAGLSGNGTTVIVDRDQVPAFEADGVARSRTTDEKVDGADYTISIDSDGAPRVTVRTSTGQRQDNRSTFSADNQGNVEVAPTPDRQADINLANGFNSFDAPVPDGGRFNVGPNNNQGEAPIGFAEGAGPQRPGFNIPRENPNGAVVDTRGQFDPATGGFVLTERAPKPKPVDSGQVDTFRAIAGSPNDGPPGAGGPNGGPTGGPNPGPTGGPTDGGGGPTGGPNPGPTGGPTDGGGGPTGGPNPGPTGGPNPGPTGGSGGGPAPAPAPGGGGAPAAGGGGAPAPAPGGGGGPAPAPAPGGGGGPAPAG